ncbi:hypothetical protein ACQB60_03280 [Actinomycetota bacterium Odt1-20B]
MTNGPMTGEQDMAHHDIALRLAEAADEVEVGIPPYAAVMRGGRRRRARRWAVGAATALALAASTGTIALAVVDGREQSQVASRYGTAEERHVYIPQFTSLTDLYDENVEEVGKAELQVWGAPRTDAEAKEQKKRMIQAGVWKAREADPTAAEGRSWHVVMVTVDGKRNPTSFGFQEKQTKGDDGLGYEAARVAVGGRHLTVGHVGPKVKDVSFEYDGGTAEPPLLKAKGATDKWFVQDDDDPGPDGKLLTVKVFDEKGKAKVVSVED